MKYLILVSLLFSMSANAEWKDKGQYDSYKDKIAKQRAAAHPKGSGIGSNRYVIKYDKDYRVEKYKRKD